MKLTSPVVARKNTFGRNQPQLADLLSHPGTCAKFADEHGGAVVSMLTVWLMGTALVS